MGCVWKCVFMIFIIMSMPLSSQNTLILSADSLLNAAEDFNGDGFKEEHGIDFKNELQKVSGEDESAGKEAFILERVRALLGLKSLQLGNQRPSDLSPSPSPSPLPATIVAEAPSPVPTAAPAMHIHEHSHPHRLRLHKSRTVYKPWRKNAGEGRVRRILVAVLVSAGATILICVLAAFWVCKKFRSQREKPIKTISVMTKTEGKAAVSKYDTSQNPDSKVSSKSGLDLFDLSLLGMGVEEQTSGVNHKTPSEKEFSMRKPRESDQEISDSEFDIVSVSSTKEMVCARDEDDRKSIPCESNGADSSYGERVIPFPVRSYSSDDESFHSCGDSNLSNLRLSNASQSSANVITNSACSIPNVNLSNHLETQYDESNTSLSSQLHLTLSSSNSEPKMQIVSTFADCQKSISSPPPPPPPPPPPRPNPFVPRSSFSLSSPFSTREETGSTSSSAWLKSSSPAMSDSSSGLSPWNDLASPQNAAKPSQPPSVIPAPPCPPPCLKPNNYTFKTPPPPPSKIPQFMAFGKDGNRPKLKPLHWDKVRAAPDRSMVWDKLRWSSFELNEEMIESLFGYNQQDSMKNGNTHSKSPSPSKHILEPKRLQNLTILLKALNVSTEQVCEAIEQGAGLRLRQLEALVKMVPTQEEEAKLSSYEGDISELGSTEKFVMAILRIPFAFQRVEAMLYRETFDDEVNHLRNSFSMLEEACKELKSSRLFLKLLEAVLKTGNRMNVGTSRGGAKAFRLDALLKLSDVKGTDGKTSLLHFVVQEMIRSEGIRVSGSIMGKISQKNKTRSNEEREDDYRRLGLELVSGLSTELYNVKRAATIDLNVLASSTGNLTEGITKLQRLVCDDLCVDAKSGNFIISMKSFLNYVKKTLDELKKDEERVLSCVKEITEYFHGNVSKEETNPLRIFVIVRDFLGMLDNVCKSFKLGS